MRWQDEEKGARRGSSTPAACDTSAAAAAGFLSEAMCHLSKEGQALDNSNSLKTKQSCQRLSSFMSSYLSSHRRQLSLHTRVIKSLRNKLGFYNYFHKSSAPFSSSPFQNNFTVQTPWMVVCTFRCRCWGWGVSPLLSQHSFSLSHSSEKLIGLQTGEVVKMEPELWNIYEFMEYLSNPG